MDLEIFFEALSNYGFPVVVAGYLLMRFENKIDSLTNSIEGADGLVVTVRKLQEAIKGSGGLLDKINELSKAIEDFDRTK